MTLAIVDLPAPKTEVERDRWGRPKIQVPGKDKPVAYTRCTTFIDCLDDKSNLALWGQRQVLVGASLKPDMLETVRLLDPEEKDDKTALNALVQKAVELAGSHTKREKGTHLHKLSEYVDRGEALPEGYSESDLLDMAAYKMATIDFTVEHMETLTVHDDLKVAGTPDRILRYTGPGPDGQTFEDEAFIGDLKTGSVEYGSLKMAMQLSIYSRSQFYDHETGERTPLPPVNQDWGVIIHLPSGSNQCTVYWVDLKTGWEAVQVAVEVRKMRSKRKVLVPFGLDKQD